MDFKVYFLLLLSLQFSKRICIILMELSLLKETQKYMNDHNFYNIKKVISKRRGLDRSLFLKISCQSEGATREQTYLHINCFAET